MSSRRTGSTRWAATAAGALAVLAVGCAEPNAPATLTRGLDPAFNETPPTTGMRVPLCKEAGPAGQYTFRITVDGGEAGVDWTLPNGSLIVLALTDEVTRHCITAWESLREGVTSTITIEEINIPEGVQVQKIDQVNYFGDIVRTVTDANWIAFPVSWSSAFAAKFYNEPYEPPPPPSGCTRTIGYWKTHAGFGPQADMVTPLLPQWLGTAGGAKSTNVTTAAQAVSVLNFDGSNGIQKLMAQLLGAKLSVASGADDTPVASAIATADGLLAAYSSADWDTMSKALRAQVLAAKDVLDNYNNGLLGTLHCE